MKKKLLFLCIFWMITLVSVQSQSRFKTVNYLNSIKGKYILSGQHNDEKFFNGSKTSVDYWTNQVYQKTGKYPALYSVDFGFESGIDRWGRIYEAERQWNAGAAVNIMWHACPPTSNNVCDWYKDIQSDLSASQWSELLTNGSNLNTIWKSRMDEISIYLQYLEDKGVEVIWRPLHEQNQTIFWWNSGTRANTRALWILTHDYMTKTKGLTNLIWNWNVQDIDTNYAPLNPGDSYFDMMSLDIYSGGHTNTSYYNAMLAQAGSKPVGLGETFKVPTATEFANQPNMSFFMVWSYGLVQDENGNPTNTTAQIQECYSNPRVITRDEMPGWNSVDVPANLATGKLVTVSSTEVGANVGANAVDGSLSTRWSSLYSDTQWLTVDLGANYNVNRVKINWEAAYGKDYRIIVSSDGVNWTTLKTITGNTSLINDHTGLSGTCRYVSMNGTARGTAYGYSIYELEVYGTLATTNKSPTVSITAPVNNTSYSAPASVTLSATATDADGTIAKVDFYNGTTLLSSDTTAPYQYSWANVASGTYNITAKATDNSGAVTTSSAASITVSNVSVPTNLATGKFVTVSSTEVGVHVGANAVDGSLSTRWSSLETDTQWLTVDLGANYNVNRVKINWEAAYGKDYRIIASSDGVNWTTLKTITGNTSLINDHTGLSGTCRYISMNGTARGTVYGYSIYEFEVYGTAVTTNQSPTVSITAPVNNTSYTAPASVTLSATATDADGTIAKVDFYNGTTLLNSDTTAPYQYSWANVASGTYTITAKATDNSGVVTTSTAVSITVNSITPVSSKKVVAYVANWIDLNSYSNTIDYSKLTHINIAFENPNANGDLSFNSSNATLIQKAHANNVKVFVSIGGGSASEDSSLRTTYFSLISDTKRAAFVSKLVAYVQSHNFDGLDVDLEGPAINGDYEKFITDLSNALKPNGKGLTAALSQGYGGSNVPASTFAYFDFINIMAYDATGPWDPSNAGQHSSYAFAQSNLQYWLGRGLAKSKAVLGLPFYGYGFGSASGEWAYSRIVATYAGAENNDQAGSTIYYNGIPTIKAKVNYAFDQDIAGVMIWELSSDAPGDKSLLLAINQVVTTRSNNTKVLTKEGIEKVVSVTPTETTDALSLFPNPTSDYITVNYKASSIVRVFNTQGVEVIGETKVEANGLLDLSKLLAGIYYIFLETENGLFTKSIIKK